MQKKKIKFPIIVEGKYDKNTLLQIFDATVITTGGFEVFNNKEKQALIRKLASKGGIILLTDSDGGGRQIRSFLQGILPSDKIHNLHIPQLEGKEKRKKTPSKAGFLGVEGMERGVLEKLFKNFISQDACNENTGAEEVRMLTKLDFFNDGFSGSENSAEKRDKLAALLDLPQGMTANALIEAINLIYGGYAKYAECISGV